ncbi:MAG TPA: phospholipid carrier-dependent glycosyltransferase, partial [Anaerolineae bacterium]|nr:phospholipid carrier-dependent glycosyltransferase [Anaerolineae bacterium]
FRWARELFGSQAALLALFLFVFDPNVLAHARLTTTDLGVTAFSFLAVYALWRSLCREAWYDVILTGMALGLALTARFSALLLCPLFLILVLWQAITRKTLRLLLALLATFVLASFTLWAVYGFQFGPLETGGLPLPAPSYLQGVQDILLRARIGSQAFLMGRYSTTGWWYYFPIAFLIKTPIPTLLFLLAALLLTALHRTWRRDIFLLMPMAAFFGVNLFGHLNIGYRYLLPALPFAFVYIAQVAKSEFGTRSLTRTVGGLLLVWYLIGTLLIYPDYLAYFNELAGGPANGYRWLVDSNLDWGQDLKGLKTYMDREGIDRIKLSYFGAAHPDYYGIIYDPLPSYPLVLGEPDRRTFYPHRPAPGIYAISVSNLQGVLLEDRDTFAWFKDQRPVASIGHSIHIYEVQADGQGTGPVSLCLSGLAVDEIDPITYDQAIGTNDVRIKWFDTRSSLIVPTAGRPGWLLASDATPLSPALEDWLHPIVSPWGTCRTVDGKTAYTLYRVVDKETFRRRLHDLRERSAVWSSREADLTSPQAEAHRLPLPVDFGHQVKLFGYELVETMHSDGQIELLTAWRVVAPTDAPLVIFAHLLDTNGQFVAGQDRLDVPPAGWEVNDHFLQLHWLTIPPDLPTERWVVEVGVYARDTLQRLPVFGGDGRQAPQDRVLLFSNQ